MPSTEQANIELVEEHFEAMNNRDTELARQQLAPDFEVVPAGFGADAYIEANRVSFWEPFPDWTETIEQIIADDDMVAFRYRFSGAHDGHEAYGVQPTGAEVEGTGLAMMECNEEGISELWVEWDSNAVLEALGILPESVGQLRMRQQLLEVLLRVLRHNISNDLNAITGMAGLIAGGDVDGQEYAQRIRDHAAGLQASAEKVRELEQDLVHSQRAEPVDIPTVVGQAVTEARQAHPTADIDAIIDPVDESITSNRATLSMVVTEAIENAIEHSDREAPAVELTVSTPAETDYPVEITIADDGPGIPEYELEPIELGRENPLDHASGIGLWAIKWGGEQLDGTVEFEENEPRGTVVRLRLPNLE